MKQPIITFTSDFGDTFAQAQVELAVLTICPQARFIVLCNDVHPYSIVEGAFLLAKGFGYAPKGTIHIGVIDPGVGSARRGVFIKTKDYWFVGPDNGLFYQAAHLDGVESVYVIDEQQVNPKAATTFHGRDIFAHVAAHLAAGVTPTKLGKSVSTDSLVALDFSDNQIVHVDAYGNLKLANHPDHLRIGDQLLLRYNDKAIPLTYQKTFAEIEPAAFLAYRGSHGTLEIAQNLGSAAQVLDAKIGDVVSIDMS